MKCIIVTQDFEDWVNSKLPSYLRLGGRVINKGEYCDQLFVPLDIFTSDCAWNEFFQNFCGNKLTDNELTFENFTYHVLDLDINDLFNEEVL